VREFNARKATRAPAQYADAPMAKRILHIHREVIHHGAEICLLRDLYLWKADGIAL
jgi:protocatechuate 3,4-dioxygenase beta subunit